MEALTRLVSESLARHGFDRPLDYRRLHWSRWFRCESHHSLLQVPSKPGVFALAEEITYVATAASAVPQPLSEAKGSGHAFSALGPRAESRTTDAADVRRMLAVTQFYEDEDMAFVLDRMLSRNPMRDRLASGAYFIRFVVIEDAIQRRSICNALNQWMLSAAEKATGIGSHFASSLELNVPAPSAPAQNEAQSLLFGPAEAGVARAPESANGSTIHAPSGTNSFADAAKPAPSSIAAPCDVGTLARAGVGTNIHCPSPFPSGF